MNYSIITDRAKWNDALLTIPSPHVLQSWDWGEVKRRHNWTPTRLLWSMDGSPVAAAQVLWRPMPHTPWGAMYVPKGPSSDYTNRTLVARMLADLEQYARRQRPRTNARED